jgi:hypothetical protein
MECHDGRQAGVRMTSGRARTAVPGRATWAIEATVADKPGQRSAKFATPSPEGHGPNPR